MDMSALGISNKKGKQMNTSHLSRSIAAAMSVAASAVALAEPPLAYEGFQYGATANIQFANGGFGWSTSWAKLSDIPTGATSTGLTYPDLAVKGGSAFTAAYPSSAFTRYSRALATYSDPDNTVYVSFLMRPNTGFGVTGGLSFGTWENGMVIGVCPSGMYGLMTPPYTNHSNSAISVIQDQTTLLVSRIQLNQDATTTWSLYVNPVVGSSEPLTPDATLIVPMAALPPAIYIYNDGGFSTDELRFGNSWASVLPKAGDVNADGITNVEDLLAVINAWGACPAPCNADLNGDGSVNVNDLLTVINNWG